MGRVGLGRRYISLDWVTVLSVSYVLSIEASICVTTRPEVKQIGKVHSYFGFCKGIDAKECGQWLRCLCPQYITLFALKFEGMELQWIDSNFNDCCRVRGECWRRCRRRNCNYLVVSDTVLLTTPTASVTSASGKNLTFLVEYTFLNILYTLCVQSWTVPLITLRMSSSQSKPRQSVTRRSKALAFHLKSSYHSI